jgi:pimeloyl-ACP methyl ester carboxylesterase
LSGLHVVRHHVEASGFPVVIVHGAPDRSKNFAHVVHRLSDLAVTVYDRRGYGKSLDAGRALDGSAIGGFDLHADDLIALLDGTPSVVCGQSAGGAIAMLAATKAPELFAALGAWEPPMVPWDWWAGDEPMTRTMEWALAEDADALGESMNRGILGDERWEQLRDTTKALLRGEGLAFRADMLSQRSPYFDLDHLKVPFLIGCGTASYSPKFADANRRLAARTNAELLVCEGADHYAHTNHPEAWVSFVRATVDLAHRSADRTPTVMSTAASAMSAASAGFEP